MNWRDRKIILSLLLIIILCISSLLFSSSRNPLNTMAGISELPIYSVNRADKVIALTFDINWAEQDNIYVILDTLEKYNAKGTFFIIGSWVTYSEENAKKLKAIVERGNEVGNHSYKHPDFCNIGDERIVDELTKTDAIIKENTGIKPKLFRFPSGGYNAKCLKKVLEEGYIPIQWNVDSIDWKEMGEQVEYQRVIDKVKPGSIVLFHNNTKYTPKNLDKILKKLSDEGYKFVTVSKLIYDINSSHIDNDGVQYKN